MNTAVRDVRRPYVPQAIRVASYVRDNPGAYIRDIHVALQIPYDSARVVVDGLLRKGEIKRGAHGPLSAVPFFVLQPDSIDTARADRA
jgi:hypothetical protein